MIRKDGRSYLKHAWIALACPLVLLVAGCTTTPVTGSRSFNLFSPAEDVQLGAEAYEQILAGERLVTSGPELQMVQRVMDRLVAVADDPGYEWEVRLIDNDQTVNAFALPGGKMAVYTGILPVCETEAGLAVVMGHEIGHVVAQHGTQRMSRSMGAEAILTAIDLGDFQTLAEGAYGLLLEMPWGRGDESESDHIGLVYMARAGYDPSEATRFWSRMASLSGGGGPEFLSTHPSHETRISDLEALMPEARKIYQAALAR
ncbi:MAG: M48 family metallopeptidase [Planctomycetota bacterium]